MSVRSVVLVATTILVAGTLSVPLYAQHHGREDERPRANQGHIPSAPPQENEVRRTEHLSTGHVNDTPHVNHDQWYGHEISSDTRFRLSQPFEHGYFTNTGPSFRYAFTRTDPARHMFWLPSGAYFEIAAWDWPFFADWCWTCGSDFVIYPDSTHPGWYIVYDLQIGQYVHAMYMGH
jgi:hypothetical protein